MAIRALEEQLWSNMVLKGEFRTSGQDGGIDRHACLLVQPEKGITTKYQKK